MVWMVDVVYSVVDSGIGVVASAEVDRAADEPSVSVTGHTVVYKSTVCVVTDPILPGQSVTVGAHDVIVYVSVSRTVEVVYETTLVDDGEELVELIAPEVAAVDEGNALEEDEVLRIELDPTADDDDLDVVIELLE